MFSPGLCSPSFPSTLPVTTPSSRLRFLFGFWELPHFCFHRWPEANVWTLKQWDSWEFSRCTGFFSKYQMWRSELQFAVGYCKTQDQDEPHQCPVFSDIVFFFFQNVWYLSPVYFQKRGNGEIKNLLNFFPTSNTLTSKLCLSYYLSMKKIGKFNWLKYWLLLYNLWQYSHFQLVSFIKKLPN